MGPPEVWLARTFLVELESAEGPGNDAFGRQVVACNVRLGVAFSLLRFYARSQARPLEATARGVVDGRVAPDALWRRRARAPVGTAPGRRAAEMTSGPRRRRAPGVA